MFREKIGKIVEEGLPRIAEARDAYAQSLVGWTNSVRDVLQEARVEFRSKMRSVEDSLKVDPNRSCRLELIVTPAYLSQRGDQAESVRTYRLQFAVDAKTRTIAAKGAAHGRSLFEEALDPRKLERAQIEELAVRFVEGVIQDLEKLYEPDI